MGSLNEARSSMRGHFQGKDYAGLVDPLNLVVEPGVSS
jgi:hypothetical protein